jgi:hypothetical protein
MLEVMRKHCFQKRDCNCTRKATEYVCKYCGEVVYAGQFEVRKMPKRKASCPSELAPEAQPGEHLRAFATGGYDCLDQGEQADAGKDCPNCR